MVIELRRITLSGREELSRALSAALVLITSATAVHAQGTSHHVLAPPPFAVGERLTYDAHAGPGLNGQAQMWIGGPENVRGTSTIVLHVTFAARVGFLRISESTTSWLDPLRMSALRFVKEEHRLLAHHTEDVTIDPSSRRWTAVDGREGTSPTDTPLDELSFIYAIRTFSLPYDSVLVLDRHFDADRSPTTVRFLGTDVVETPAGVFATREIEMRVRDARNYDGEGVIRVSLSDDACRRPVRIRSRIPGAGTVVLVLASAEPAIAACLPRTVASSH